MFRPLLKLETRFAAREAGYGFSDINAMMRNCDDEKISQAVTMARGMGYAIPDELVNADSGGGRAAIGDGTILKAILAFFQSEQGQALIKILLTILTAAIAA